MSTAVDTTRSLQKEWWLRALAVFSSPRATFAALRDESAEAAEARQEPIVAIVILAGIAGILSTSLAGRLLDDSNNDGLNVAICAFLEPSTGCSSSGSAGSSSTRLRPPSGSRPRTGRRGTSSGSPWRPSRSRC